MRSLIRIGLAALALAAAAGGAQAAPTPPPQAKGVLKTQAGEAVGNVLLTQLPDGSVAISAEVKNLPPGAHGLSLRERGACGAGFDGAGSAILGDMTITVKPDRTGALTASTDKVSVAPGARSVLDGDGTAVVLTGLGDEGVKIACTPLEAVPVPRPAGSAGTTRASAEFKTAAGETVGSATLTQNPDGSVRVQAQVRGLPPGEHAIHFHQFGMCAPTFGAAGEHHNPFNTPHGSVPSGPHSGDIPNMSVAADGTGSLDYTTRLVTLTPGDSTVLDSDGTALIIHERLDDYVSQPSGNAGGRIACAVIQAASQAQPGRLPGQTTGEAPAPEKVPSQLPNTGAADARPDLTLLLALLLAALGAHLLARSRRARP